MKLSYLLPVICLFCISCNHSTKQAEPEPDEDAVEASLSLAIETEDDDEILRVTEEVTDQDTTGMNLDINKLKRHLEFQENALMPDEYTFITTYPEYPQSRYKYTIEDLLLTLPLIEKELKNSGLKSLSDEDFRKRILEVFGIDINTEGSENGIIPLLTEDDKNDPQDRAFHNNVKYLPNYYYIEKNKKYIIYMFRLECLIGIIDGEIKLKSSSNNIKNVVAMNRWLLENNNTAFKMLKLSKVNSESDWCDLMGTEILGSLFTGFYYDTDTKLNQWGFDEGNVYTSIINRKRGELYISEPLIKTLEDNTSTDEHNYLDELGFHVFEIIKGERCVYFTEEDKIKIYHRFAILEKKLRDKYMTMEAPPAGWGASTTALVRTNFEEFYKKALETATGEAKEAMMDLTDQ